MHCLSAFLVVKIFLYCVWLICFIKRWRRWYIFWQICSFSTLGWSELQVVQTNPSSAGNVQTIFTLARSSSLILLLDLGPKPVGPFYSCVLDVKLPFHLFGEPSSRFQFRVPGDSGESVLPLIRFTAELHLLCQSLTHPTTTPLKLCILKFSLTFLLKPK